MHWMQWELTSNNYNQSYQTILLVTILLILYQVWIEFILLKN